MSLLVITGMSGSGKSRAIDSLEDIGFYCVDNLPPSFLVTFARFLKIEHRLIISLLSLILVVKICLSILKENWKN